MSVFSEHKDRWDKGQAPDYEERITIHGESMPVQYFEGNVQIGRMEFSPKDNKISVVLVD